MIGGFLESWELFHHAYIAGLLMVTVLSLIGVLVVARDQIFIGASVSQASMLGIALGILASDHIALEGLSKERVEALHVVCGGIVAVMGALLTVGRGRGRETREAITGWVFLVSGSLSVLLVAHSPHGLAEVHRLLASTIIGARRSDVVAWSVALLLSVLVVVRFRDALVLFVSDAEMARAVGIPVLSWDRLLAVWLGVTTASAIHVSGTLYAFGCMVLPGLIAKNLCREVGQLFLVAPLVGAVSALAAFVVAHAYDYPPAQVAVAILSALLAAAWVLRAVRG